MLLPASVSTSPMTYMANRKQYIVVAVSAAIAGRAGGARSRVATAVAQGERIVLKNASWNSEAHVDDVFRAP